MHWNYVIAGYLIVWVAKFLLLDRLFGRSRATIDEQPDDALVGGGL